MKKLKLTFDKNDKSGRGSVFVFAGKKNEIYLRARIQNTSSQNLGRARLFLTRIERVNGRRRTLITDDTFGLNWALTSGADVEFWPGYTHNADILTFTQGAKHFTPMVTRRAPSYWPQALAIPGEYRLSLLLTGENSLPVRATLKVQWPTGSNLSRALSFHLSR